MAAEKLQKRRFYIIRAYRGGHGGKYKYDTSVTCLYCAALRAEGTPPYFGHQPLRCRF